MYAKIENNVAVEYPVYEGDLERRFPQYKFPLDTHTTENAGVLCPEGYVKVLPNTTTVFRHDMRYTLGMPALDPIDGIWKEQYAETPLTNEEKLAVSSRVATQIRKQRDILLQESDSKMLIDRWELLSDSAKQDLKDYRSALRNIPEQPGFPFIVEFPTPLV